MKQEKKEKSCSCKNVNSQIDEDIGKICKVFILVGTFMVLEIWGHWVSNTLSLLADSIHLLVDLLGFIVSLLALQWTKISSTSRMNFGHGRVEILGALFSIFLIWAAVGYLLVEAYFKFKHPYIIDGKVFMIISIVGFLVNLVCFFFLHDTHHDHDHIKSKNLNMRATYIHIIGDLVQSFGVLLAGMITYFYPNLVIVDVLCTFLFSIIVLITTGNILKDGIKILLESVPDGVNLSRLTKELELIKGIYTVIDIKAWAISAKTRAINVVILLEKTHLNVYEKVLMDVKEYLKTEKEFDFINIQLETFETIYSGYHKTTELVIIDSIK